MKATAIWFEYGRIYATFDDGRCLWQSLLYYPRLRNASEVERQDYVVDSEGIHWEKIDEDVSFESFEYDNPEPEGVSLLFLSHPELNAAAIARRIGIDRGEMQQYVSGVRRPSVAIEKKILAEVESVGKELIKV